MWVPLLEQGITDVESIGYDIQHYVFWSCAPCVHHWTRLQQRQCDRSSHQLGRISKWLRPWRQRIAAAQWRIPFSVSGRFAWGAYMQRTVKTALYPVRYALDFNAFVCLALGQVYSNSSSQTRLLCTGEELELAVLVLRLRTWLGGNLYTFAPAHHRSPHFAWTSPPLLSWFQGSHIPSGTSELGLDLGLGQGLAWFTAMAEHCFRLLRGSQDQDTTCPSMMATGTAYPWFCFWLSHRIGARFDGAAALPGPQLQLKE